MAHINYHHLRYFWVIANESSLTRAAERLHVSQSALSIQVRKLEDSLGQRLFDRENRRLVLTEAGRIALDYAQTIFRAGDELLNTLKNRPSGNRQTIRIGAVATLSRNFQLQLLQPLIDRPDLDLIVRSGSLAELLAQLQAHSLDLVLSNSPVRRDTETGWHSHLLDAQSVSLVSRYVPGEDSFRFPDDLATTPLLLPTLESDIRAAFDLLLDQAGIRPIIAAEVDDMAMLRLLARESEGVTLVPRVVVQDELQAGVLIERHRIAQIKESFYAITPTRRFPNPLVRELVLQMKAAPGTISGAAKP
ncbi:MAG: LysR family transcriptional regulator [Candidatus Competibacteraceae bacterium]|jgi:LysR family transcriptional activator of nhaA|nr:LysR family transcriptional regulator [Candidatus Competibacteraceae bacterium]